MAEKSIELSTEKIEQIRQAVNKYRDELAGYFKGVNYEVKDWRFAIETSKEGHTIDAAIKILLKPKK